jgi:hypothetical protein
MMISLTFDIEKDLHSETYKSLSEGIPELVKIINKKNIKVTFFVPAKLLETFPDYFRKLKKQGHEIAIHGYEHERFDDLSLDEKEKRIKKSMKIYKKIFKENPRGFRAPQHSIDKETLIILDKNKFIYDSSYTPLNFLQLFFFPKNFLLWLKGFFSPRKVYKIEGNLYEIPVSGFLIPFVSLPLRIFSFRQLKIFLWFIEKTNSNLIFYAHSWDFIPLPTSKIDKNFSYIRLLNNLDKIIDYLYKKNKFVKMENLK